MFQTLLYRILDNSLLFYALWASLSRTLLVFFCSYATISAACADFSTTCVNSIDAFVEIGDDCAKEFR